MKLNNVMTKVVEVVHPDDTLRSAAEKMKEHDIGFLPVCDGEQLVGVLTDRDIILRSTATGTDPDTPIGRDREFITAPVVYCFDDESVEEAAKLMEEKRIRRVAVLSRKDKRLVGIVSLGDIATNGTKRTAAKILEAVSEPVEKA
jgi:CBS domain-containing protein